MKFLISILLLFITFPLFSDYNAKAVMVATYRYEDSEDDIVAGYVEFRVGAEKLLLVQTLLNGLSTLTAEEFDRDYYSLHFFSSFRYKIKGDDRILDHDYDVLFDTDNDCVEVDVHQKTEILFYEAMPESYEWNLVGDFLDDWD